MAKGLLMFGRGLGALTGAITSAGWAFAMWVPTAGLPLSGISFVVALLMLLLALFGAIGALRGHTLVVVLVFLASFFPVGFALFAADHWLAWIGRFDLGFLIAGLAMWTGGRSLRLVGSSAAT